MNSGTEDNVVFLKEQNAKFQCFLFCCCFCFGGCCFVLLFVFLVVLFCFVL